MPGKNLCTLYRALILRLSGADPENSERGGRILPTPPYENFTFQDMQLTALWRIRDASKVTFNVSEDRMKEHFIKQFSKQNRKTFENTRKKGGPRPPRPLP